MRLLLEFNTELQIIPDEDEKRQREQARRRHKHLQELADVQIREIISTLMSVSTRTQILSPEQERIDDSLINSDTYLDDSLFDSVNTQKEDQKFIDRHNKLTELYTKTNKNFLRTTENDKELQAADYGLVMLNIDEKKKLSNSTMLLEEPLLATRFSSEIADSDVRMAQSMDSVFDFKTGPLQK